MNISCKYWSSANTNNRHLRSKDYLNGSLVGNQFVGNQHAGLNNCWTERRSSDYRHSAMFQPDGQTNGPCTSSTFENIG